MATEDQILLRLVIQGQDPAQIEQLAQSTQGQLNAKIKVLIDQLTQAHRDAQSAMTADAVKESEKRKDVLEKQIDTIQKVQRANEIAANRASNAWKGTLEVMENIATSATFMYGVLSSGIGRLQALGEEIDKTTNIYHSLKGSIDEMREASKGEVSDIDLIATKNRALEKDLELTDKQFGLVASAADNFADAIGTNTKEALDKLVDGLAQGRLKSLAQAGVVIDSTKAFADYAKSIGVAADQLSEHGKRMAIIQAALDKLAEKTKAAGPVVEDFSHEWEKMTAELDNSRKSMQLWLGQMAVDTWKGLKDIPQALALQFARIKDVITLGTQDYEKAFLDKLGHENDARDALTKMAGQKFRKYGQDIDPNDFLHPGGAYSATGDRADSINQAKIDEDAKKAQAAADAIQKIVDSFDKMLRRGSGLITAGADAADIILARTQTPEERALGNSYNPDASRNALGGLNNETARSQAYAKAQRDQQDRIDRSMEAPKESNDLSAGTDSKGAMDRMDKSLKEAQARLDALRKGAGDGILSALFFGTDGPSGVSQKLKTWGDEAKDALDMVTAAGMKMGEALGGALAAFVSGDKSKRTSLRQTTHDVLESLATQAYTRAIFESAEGLAALALGPIGGASASMHFAAAGMFAAVGTSAALGARAVGNPSAAAGPTQQQQWQQQQDDATAKKQWQQSHGYGTSTSTSGSGGFGSNGVRSSPDQSGQPLTINLTVMPGGEAEAGRQINKALNAYYSQTGQGVPAAMVAA